MRSKASAPVERSGWERTVPVQRKVSPASVVPANEYGLSPPPLVRKDSSRTVSGPSALSNAGRRVASRKTTRASSTASFPIERPSPPAFLGAGAAAWGCSSGGSRSWKVSAPSASRPRWAMGCGDAVAAVPAAGGISACGSAP
jgi:hypothetical protein